MKVVAIALLVLGGCSRTPPDDGWKRRERPPTVVEPERPEPLERAAVASSEVEGGGVVVAPHTFRDARGSTGRRDQRGYFHARDGNVVGHRNSRGNYYNRAGLAGRVDSTANYYDANGRYLGRRNVDGSYYDRTGAYRGRIDVSGNLYDQTGVTVGHIDEPCDDDCKQDAVARQLLPLD